jgi:hypothetical protein
MEARMNETNRKSTMVGVFDYYNTARAAAQELMEIGIPREDVQVQSNVAAGAAGSSIQETERDAEHEHHEGGIRGFFHRLFGDRDDHTHYSEAVRRGSTVVVVTAPSEMVDRAADILNQHGAIDIDRRVAEYREAGWQQHDANAPAYTSEEAARERERSRGADNTQAIRVVEEEIAAGKRVIRRGGVRIYTEVVEDLRVERRPVDREVAPRDTELRDESSR